jgi:hypothetical protein
MQYEPTVKISECLSKYLFPSTSARASGGEESPFRKRIEATQHVETAQVQRLMETGSHRWFNEKSANFTVNIPVECLNWASSELGENQI